MQEGALLEERAQSGESLVSTQLAEAANRLAAHRFLAAAALLHCFDQGGAGPRLGRLSQAAGCELRTLRVVLKRLDQRIDRFLAPDVNERARDLGSDARILGVLERGAE